MDWTAAVLGSRLKVVRVERPGAEVVEALALYCERLFVPPPATPPPQPGPQMLEPHPQDRAALSVARTRAGTTRHPWVLVDIGDAGAVGRVAGADRDGPTLQLDRERAIAAPTMGTAERGRMPEAYPRHHVTVVSSPGPILGCEILIRRREGLAPFGSNPQGFRTERDTYFTLFAEDAARVQACGQPGAGTAPGAGASATVLTWRSSCSV